MAIGGEDVQGHAFDAELEERLGADVAYAPELQLAGADRYHRIDLAIDGEDFVLAQLGVLDEEEAFRQAPDYGKKLLRAVDDETARHPAQDLFVHHSMSVRVIPEESGALPASGWDAHLVFEPAARMHVDEDVVAPSLRRNAHPVEMQVRRIVRKRVPEVAPQGVAPPRPKQRRHIGAVVEKAGEC